MAPIIDYIRGEYVTTLLKGRCDPRATEQMIRKLTKLPGAASSFPAPSGGCLQTQAYLDEVYRTERKLGSRLDSNPAARDLSLDALPQERGDPILNGEHRHHS